MKVRKVIRYQIMQGERVISVPMKQPQAISRLDFLRKHDMTGLKLKRVPIYKPQ